MWSPNLCSDSLFECHPPFSSVKSTLVQNAISQALHLWLLLSIAAARGLFHLYLLTIFRITSRHPDDPRQPFWNETGAPMKPLAKLTLTRQRLYKKSCVDEEIPFTGGGASVNGIVTDFQEAEHGEFSWYPLVMPAYPSTFAIRLLLYNPVDAV